MNSRASRAAAHSPLVRCAVGLATAVLATHAAAFDTVATASAYAMNVGNVSNTSNGTFSAGATADLGGWNAVSSAAIGHLGGSATVGGCVDPTLFQQPCAASSSFTQFDDMLHVTGTAPDGTPVTIELDWSVDGTVNGIGNYLLQAVLVAGNTGVSVSNIGFIVPNTPFVDVPIGGSKSLVIDTSIGANIPLSGWMNLGVSDTACAGGSDFCDDSLGWSITADASHTALVTGKVLTPGIQVQLIGDSGHDYAAQATPVPEPSSALLLAAGLAAIGGARWRTQRRLAR